MKKITGLSNPLIKHIVSLHASKNRRAHKQCIAEGIRTIETLMSGHLEPHYILALPQHMDTALALKVHANTAILEVSDSVMHKISPAATPSGILAIFAIPDFSTITLKTPGIVLANISDPGNMGTLIRTAVALNLKTIVIVDGADCWSPKVVQSTAGTIGTMPVYTLSWQELQEHTHDISLCGLVVSGGKNPNNIDLKKQLLVIGNEAHGIDAAWINDCNELLSLPMPGNAESLNAAVAGSIAMYLTTLS